ncbi:MAG: dTMP kinase, partial [Acidobacteriota bacterium]
MSYRAKNAMKKKGILIAVEGIDGSGKSTQVQRLSRYLEKKGYEVICLKEPTEGSFGKKIKEKSAFDGSLTPAEELELFIRDRKENVVENIQPALSKGKIVI